MDWDQGNIKVVTLNFDVVRGCGWCRYAKVLPERLNDKDIYHIMGMEGNYLVAIMQNDSLITSSLIFFNMFPRYWTPIGSRLCYVGGQGALRVEVDINIFFELANRHSRSSGLANKNPLRFYFSGSFGTLWFLVCGLCARLTYSTPSSSLWRMKDAVDSSGLPSLAR
jgi:hypothetical protein